MRLLITTSLFYPSTLGGPSRTLYWLAKGLISKGVEVHVIATNQHIDDPTIIFDEWTKIDNIFVKYCIVKSKYSLKFIFNSIVEIKKADVLMLSSLCFLPNIFIAFYAMVLRKKVIWSPRGELLDAAIGNNKLKHFYVWIIQLLFSNYVLFHTTSKEEKQSVKNFLGENVKTVIVPNFMEFQEMEIRNPMDNYFLYVGRIAPIKALDNMILGFLGSDKFMSSNFKLILAGPFEGDYYLSLKQLIEENIELKDKVVFVGNVTGKEKSLLYANAYFSLLVSHSENFGNVVIESMAQGTPSICSTGTPWEILKEQGVGFWIDNDELSISRCVDQVIGLSPQEYGSLRMKSYEFCKNNYEIYENVDKWVNVITNV